MTPPPAGKRADGDTGGAQTIEQTTTAAVVPAAVATPKTPPRVRAAKKKPLSSPSPSKKKLESSVATAGEPISSTTSSDHHHVDTRVVALEQQLLRARKTADARRKEADSLRKRVQELEPEVLRLEKELKEKRMTIERQAGLASSSSRSPRSIGRRVGEDDVALRGRLTAAENRARALQLRCDRLEHERSCSVATKTGTKRKDNEKEEEEEDNNNVRGRGDVNGGGGGGGGGGGRPRAKDSNPDDDSEAKRISRQLEVAERRVKNSLYINEAHESLAAKATAGEREANARTAELARKLNRTLEKLESIERRDMIAGLQASCVRDEEGIHLTERELRAHQMDPELDLPVNTAKRRQLARSEQHLRRLRLRHESQLAALAQAQSTERLHSDLRRAAGCGIISATVACVESGAISVNVPDENGLSAFLYACGQENAELIRVMIDVGGDVLDGDGTITGLIIAARKGALDVVETLLQAGADVNARDSAGGTALHAATLRRHVDVARALLEAGCDSNATDQGTNTPLHTLAAAGAGPAGGGGGGGGGEEARGAELVSLLLEWGASADTKNSAGLTPISAALDARNRPLVLAYRTFFGEDGGTKLLADEFDELDSREPSP